MSDEGRITGTGRPQGLGELLRSSRESRGLDLADVAELTHVRKEYLRALEEGRYQDLPEDVYTRNFVRLFAQAVGVDSERALSAYQVERRQAGGLSTLEERLDKERRGEKPPPPKRRRGTDRPGRGFSLGPLVPTLVLVVALVALAVWGFNRLMAPGGGAIRGDPPVVTQSQKPPDAAPAAGTPSAGEEAQEQPPGPATVLITVLSEPPGATVSIDSFVLPGTTPIQDVPVTARRGRVLSVTLDGFQPLEETVDLLEDQTLTVNLAPLPAEEAAADAGPAASDDQLVIEVTAPTWLEVYRGSARNQGERLAYYTAQPGEVLTYDLPVYVYVGNAAGVNITQGSTNIGTLGSSGAIVGRAFGNQ
ncbi:MAG TPA: RodZ domain-containing protein [Trueperaceae bacterium]